MDTVIKDLLEYFNLVKRWVKKRRMKIIIQKNCIFSRKAEILQYPFQMIENGKEIRRNRKPKLLGVILDEQLKYHEHVKYVERKAHKIINTLSIIAKTENINLVNTSMADRRLLVTEHYPKKGTGNSSCITTYSRNSSHGG